jgi:N-acyl-D-amino-acid deacylase
VVFDPRTVIDRATFEKPALSEGVRDVLVNGRLALRDGRVTAEQGGAVVRRTANMPTRPLDLSAPRRAKGAVRMPDGARLAFDLRQGQGRPGAQGQVVLKDAAGQELFVAEALGLLQTAPAWASVTGEGRMVGGERRAFTLILDKAEKARTQGRGVVLSIESEPDRIAAGAAGVVLEKAGEGGAPDR